MAARTMTYTINMAASPVKIIKGLNALPFDFNSGATKFGTLSDVALLGKIPNGALITDADIRFGVMPQQAAHFALLLLVTDADGTFSTLATLIGSMTATQTAVTTFSSRVPVKVSLSDDRAVQYATLALNCTTGGSETVSVSFQGNVKYLSDGRNV
jgi:hypothetical protein